jgi:hypothetical protein
MDTNCFGSDGGIRPGAIVGGAFLLVLGGTMFIERSGIADVSVGRIIGPACLIILGMLMLLGNGGIAYGRREKMPDGTVRANVRTRGGLTGGLWLVGVGCWMLVSQLHLFGLDYGTSWPLLLILSGTIMLARGVR